jgi:hypothetical protein
MPTTEQTVKKLFAAIDKETEDQSERYQKKLQIICDELFLNLVATVEAHYDGEGDSGDIYNLEFFDVDKKRSKYELPKLMHDTLLNACFHYLPSGFEINAGGFGVLTIDVRQKNIKIEHSGRVVDTYDETYKYTF